MEADGGAEEKPAEDPKPAQEPAAQDLKDIVDTDFMKGIISDLNLNVDEGAVDDILGAMDKKDEKDEDKDKKPDSDKK